MTCCSCHRTEAERAYSIQQAAELKGIPVGTVRAAIRAVEGNYLRAKKVGRSYSIAASDLEAWWERLDDASTRSPYYEAMARSPLSPRSYHHWHRPT